MSPRPTARAVVLAATIALAVDGPAGGETTVQALYRSECAGCHGEQGDGKGLADPELIPPPRDFTRGKFKIRSTDPRKPVSAAELARTITNGLPGSAMPSYRFLTDDERTRLARYVRLFGTAESVAAGEPVPVPAPPPVDSALVGEGRTQYNDLGCAACHGDSGRGDGGAADALRDEWGTRDPPRDLTRDPYRGGENDRDIYLRLAIGMPGTPMPGYAEVASGRSLWALVAYLKSIRQPAPTPPDPRARDEQVFTSHHCRACHQLGGKGGRIAMSLDGLERRVRAQWLRMFLANPRPVAYPAGQPRMPPPNLAADEIEAIIRYLGVQS